MYVRFRCLTYTLSILLFLAALVIFTLLGTDWPTRIATTVMVIIVVTLSIWVSVSLFETYA